VRYCAAALLSFVAVADIRAQIKLPDVIRQGRDAIQQQIPGRPTAPAAASPAQCQALVQWMAILPREVPNVDFYHTVLGPKIYDKMLNLFRDEYFRTLFGKPFSQTTPEERLDYHRAVFRTCATQGQLSAADLNIFRDLNGMLGRPFIQPRGDFSAETVMTGLPQLQALIAWTQQTLQNLDSTPASPEGFQQLEGDLRRGQTDLEKLWPREQQAFLQAVVKRQSFLASSANLDNAAVAGKNTSDGTSKVSASTRLPPPQTRTAGTQSAPSSDGNCSTLTTAVHQVYPDVILSARRSGACTYVRPEAGVSSSYEHKLEVEIYSAGQALNFGLLLETYSHPSNTTSFHAIPNLGQLAEIVTTSPRNSYLSVYRNNKIAFYIRYSDWPVTDLDIKNASIITNSILGPYDGQVHPEPVPAPPVVHTSPATYGLASPDCRVMTEAVAQIFSHPTRAVMTEMPGRDSCFYNFHDTASTFRANKSVTVTLYGERGEPISNYQRPRNITYRTLPDLGQLAEYIELTETKSSISSQIPAVIVLYRNNRKALEINFLNFSTNPAISGGTSLIGSILGPYKVQDAPLSEPKGPPK
jgi:hypothetical protein